MEITVREEGAVMILALSGELDAVNSPRLDHAIADLLAEGRRQFLIDLIAVSFVGYVSLGHSFEIGNLRDGWCFDTGLITPRGHSNVYFPGSKPC